MSNIDAIELKSQNARMLIPIHSIKTLPIEDIICNIKMMAQGTYINYAWKDEPICKEEVEVMIKQLKEAYKEF